MSDLFADSDDETVNIDTSEALKRAIDERKPVEVVQHILDEAVEDETHNGRLYPMIKYALRENDKGPPLHAIKAPPVDPEVMHLLIQHDPEVANVNNENGGFLLHWACEYVAPIEIIRLLINLNPDALHVPRICKDWANVRYGGGMVPLNVACDCLREKISVDTIQLLLTCCPEAAKVPDSCGRLPLHHTLEKSGPENVIMSLLDVYPGGARVEDERGNLPLHHSFDRPRICRRLVMLYPECARRADLYGYLPLHSACNDMRTLDVVKILYEAYPEAIRLGDERGALPLHLVLRHRWFPEQTATFEFLIDKFPEAVQHADNFGQLPIHCACRIGAPTHILRLLMDHYHGEADHLNGLRVADNDGRFPLDVALKSARKSTETFQFLLGRDPEGTRRRDNEGRLPLHGACAKMGENHNREIIRPLLEIDPESARTVDADGDLPLHLLVASYFGYESHLEVVQCLYEEYPEAIHFRGHNGLLPLHCALGSLSRGERTAIVEFLIEKHPEAVQIAYHDGKLPIHVACMYGAPSHIIQLLMDHYRGEAIHVCGLRVADNDGRIPLHCFARKGRTWPILGPISLETVQLLLEIDPEGVRVRDNAGRLPLHSMCMREFENRLDVLEVIRLLLEIDPFTIIEPCGDGRTALQLAFDANGEDAHTLETKRFLVSKQDEALQATNEGFQYVMDMLVLPDLVAANIRGYLLPPRLWRPTEEDWMMADSDYESSGGSEFDSYFSSDAESVASDVQ